MSRYYYDFYLTFREAGIGTRKAAWMAAQLEAAANGWKQHAL